MCKRLSRTKDYFSTLFRFDVADLTRAQSRAGSRVWPMEVAGLLDRLCWLETYLSPLEILIRVASGSIFDGERHSHTAANTESRQAALRLAFLHFVNKRNGNARAGTTDRMPECD